MSDATSLTVPFARPSISEEEKQAVLEILDSGWLTTGKKALEFENNFSAFMNKIDTTKKRKELSLNTNPVISLAVNSNTSGMILAMEACGVTNNTAVITTPYTFVSTAMCARHLGADVYFADVEKDSYNIDVANIEKILQNDTEHKIKAIVPVHIAGALCNMEKICALAKKYNVKTAETIWQAKLKCPDLVTVPPHHEKYKKYFIRGGYDFGLVNPLRVEQFSEMTFNGVTEYKLPISEYVLPTKQNWRIYEPTRK